MRIQLFNLVFFVLYSLKILPNSEVSIEILEELLSVKISGTSDSDAVRFMGAVMSGIVAGVIASGIAALAALHASPM